MTQTTPPTPEFIEKNKHNLTISGTGRMEQQHIKIRYSCLFDVLSDDAEDLLQYQSIMGRFWAMWYSELKRTKGIAKGMTLDDAQGLADERDVEWYDYYHRLLRMMSARHLQDCQRLVEPMPDTTEEALKAIRGLHRLLLPEYREALEVLEECMEAMEKG